MAYAFSLNVYCGPDVNCPNPLTTPLHHKISPGGLGLFQQLLEWVITLW